MSRHSVRVTNPLVKGACTARASRYCSSGTAYRLDDKAVCTYCIVHLIENGDLHLVDPVFDAPTTSASSIVDIEVAWE